MLFLIEPCHSQIDDSIKCPALEKKHRHVLLGTRYPVWKSETKYGTKVNWLVVWNMFYFPIILGISSSQLTNSIIFQRGRAQPPTSWFWDGFPCHQLRQCPCHPHPYGSKSKTSKKKRRSVLLFCVIPIPNNGGYQSLMGVNHNYDCQISRLPYWPRSFQIPSGSIPDSKTRQLCSLGFHSNPLENSNP